jgi:hypothetical protein
MEPAITAWTTTTVNYDIGVNYLDQNGAWYTTDVKSGAGPVNLNTTMTKTSTTPTTAWQKLVVNIYDTNRAHMAIRTFQSEGSINLTVTGFLSNGDNWELRDPMDFFGDPLQSGTCDGSTISIAMSSSHLAGILVKV